ncbi:MAG TPA: hypothetical protein VGL35_09120 [Rhizomicrobium sp.]|jgi:hypothetical protein
MRARAPHGDEGTITPDGLRDNGKAMSVFLRLPKVALWLWLVLSIALAIHAMGPGGGLAAPILLWELQKYGEVYRIDTIWLLGLVLILPPIFLLRRFYARRPPQKVRPSTPEYERRQLQGIRAVVLLLVAIATGATVRALSLPGPADPIVTIALDTWPVNRPVPDGHAVLLGTPQPDYLLSYVERARGLKITNSTSTTHNIVPMTERDWMPGRPVRFLADWGVMHLEKIVRSMGAPARPPITASPPGFVTSGNVPGYVRAWFEARGVVLADDAILLTPDADAARTGWIVLAALSGCLAFPILIALVTAGLVRPQH